MPDVYDVIAVDGALDRPGFASFRYDHGRISNIRLHNLNNKGKNKCHGQKLDEIISFFQNEVMIDNGVPVFYIRSHAVGGKFHNDTAIYEQVGILNWYLWIHLNKDWIELYPSTVKKLITGNGKSTKEEVRESLPQFVGPLYYGCDDESDALALGISFLLQNEQKIITK